MVPIQSPRTTEAKIAEAMSALEAGDGLPRQRVRRAAPAILAANPDHLPYPAGGILVDLQQDISAAREEELSRTDYSALVSQLRAVMALIDYRDQRLTS